MGPKPTDASLAEVAREDKLTGVFLFLDELRESQTTNMFGAGTPLMEHCNCHRDIAKSILMAWMRTFSTSLTARERATIAEEQHMMPHPAYYNLP